MTEVSEIKKIHAVRLAESYHDAMTMVSNKSTVGVPGTKSPRQILEGYLQASKVCGVQMHNDTWEERAEAVVQELTQKRRDAWAKALGAK